MNLNLFEHRKKENSFINNFIEELKNTLNNTIKGNNNSLDEYNLYEKKKIFLDNKSRTGNDLAWVMDSNSICISENGDGGPISISEINMPDNIKVGDVYEKINGEYIYNQTLTTELNEIIQ